ncbi:MAG TPA: hypothetical protein VGR26_00425 [Acidimicrobiales bacterium]|nr:hypothetical protein [Acidimicrobiales bacterium]
MPIVRNGAQQASPQRGTRARTRQQSNGARQRGEAAAATAQEQGQQVKATAVERSQQVASEASDHAREVAGSARQQAAQITQEVTMHGRDLYDETRQQVQERAETQTRALAQALHRWGDETQALVDGRPEDAGTMAEYAQQWSDKLHDVGEAIEMRGVDGLLEEVQDLARRRPGAFLLGAALIGFGGGRLIRSAGSGGDGSTGGDGGPRGELEPASPRALAAARGGR